ncbi:MAG TPA: molybdopterin-dependent oxidoreductase, partial [Longimicrobiales bacterium]|nr:molybdopterin-dependent oxidoreductase [Longimicrobiales bacterium]
RAAGNAPVKAVVSPGASNEDIGALRALVDALGGGDIVYRMERAEDEAVLKGYPTLARRRDLAANGRGAEIMGATLVGDDDGTGGLEEMADHDGVLIVLGDELDDQSEDFGRAASTYVYLGAHPSRAATHADAVLPVTTFAEQEGTFTNLHGRVQRFRQGLQAPGAARPAWLILEALAADLAGRDTAPTTAAEAFAVLSGRVEAFAGLTYEAIGDRGAVVNETVQLAGD